MINGIVFQRNSNRMYRGIEGDNWYLNDLYPDIFGEYFEENIEKAWYDSNYIDVCCDKWFIEKYIELSELNKINFRVLLCETDRISPKMKYCFKKEVFLGYDYAYSGGSYYSAVYNDICSGRINEFSSFALNENGLFNDIEKIKEFIMYRNALILKNRKEMFEGGDFTIYKLFEIAM